ncbi:MAG: RNase adapter RapZ [Candidatus Pacebacteria bacterium]|nr:RNase adapter RapZ [Candidatus Paceibacterota bacterium]
MIGVNRNVSSGTAAVVVITGMSGAGLSLALKSLEDIGFEAVDNIPLALVAELVRGRDPAGPRLAIGIDNRTRDFSSNGLIETLTRVQTESGEKPFLVFIECDDEVLSRRYTETRRRHPLATTQSVTAAIQSERDFLQPIKQLADLVMDTSLLPAKMLQQQLELRFMNRGSRHLTLTFESFSYRFGLPREADLVFDLRFLRNPHWDRDIRPYDGRDTRVAAFIAADPIFGAFFANLENLLLPLLPRWRAEGRSYLTIACGCTGGRHRSVFVTEKLANRIRQAEQSEDLIVRILHRDLERQSHPPDTLGLIVK